MIWMGIVIVLIDVFRSLKSVNELVGVVSLGLWVRIIVIEWIINCLISFIVFWVVILLYLNLGWISEIDCG